MSNRAWLFCCLRCASPNSPCVANEEKLASGDHSPISNASSVKCFAVNPEYHHERPWSSSSSTLSISDVRSNQSSPSRSHHTADTSINLSQTSFKTAPQLPSLTFLPIPENPDNFNIDDYISTDASSIKGHQRHTGESEEELLFNDFGYGAQGTQLPGLLESSTLFERAASPIPIPQNQHCRCSSWSTTPINAGSFGRAVGGQRSFILDTGVEDDSSDETDYEQHSSGLMSLVPLHSPKPQHHHALSGDFYNGVVGHVPRTRTFGSDRTSSLQSLRGARKKRTPAVLNCRGIETTTDSTRPITPVSPPKSQKSNEKDDSIVFKTPDYNSTITKREKGKQKMEDQEEESGQQLPPSTSTSASAILTAATSSVAKRRKQIKAGKRATGIPVPARKQRPQTSQGVVTTSSSITMVTPKSPRSPRSPRTMKNRTSVLQRPRTAGAGGGGEYSDEEHHADTEAEGSGTSRGGVKTATC